MEFMDLGLEPALCRTRETMGMFLVCGTQLSTLSSGDRAPDIWLVALNPTFIISSFNHLHLNKSTELMLC